MVNLERPVRADGRLGGHFVLGHVDGVGRITALRPDGDCHWLEVECPAGLAPLLVPKGSVAVDGVSLTVAALAGRAVWRADRAVHLGAHGAAVARVGDAVNLEADVIGKYVARWVEAHRGTPAPVEHSAVSGDGTA